MSLDYNAVASTARAHRTQPTGPIQEAAVQLAACALALRIPVPAEVLAADLELVALRRRSVLVRRHGGRGVLEVSLDTGRVYRTRRFGLRGRRLYGPQAAEALAS